MVYGARILFCLPKIKSVLEAIYSAEKVTEASAPILTIYDAPAVKLPHTQMNIENTRALWYNKITETKRTRRCITGTKVSRGH